MTTVHGFPSRVGFGVGIGIKRPRQGMGPHQVSNRAAARFGATSHRLPQMISRIVSGREELVSEYGVSRAFLSRESQDLAEKLRNRLHDTVDTLTRQANSRKPGAMSKKAVGPFPAREFVKSDAVQGAPYRLDLPFPEIALASLAANTHREFEMMSVLLGKVKGITPVAQEAGFRWYVFSPDGTNNPNRSLVLCLENMFRTGGTVKRAYGPYEERIEPVFTPRQEFYDSPIFLELLSMNSKITKQAEV